MRNLNLISLNTFVSARGTYYGEYSSNIVFAQQCSSERYSVHCHFTWILSLPSPSAIPVALLR